MFKVGTEIKPKAEVVTFRLPEDLVDRLRKAAKENNMPVTRLVKQMLEYCLKSVKE